MTDFRSDRLLSATGFLPAQHISDGTTIQAFLSLKRGNRTVSLTDDAIDIVLNLWRRAHG